MRLKRYENAHIQELIEVDRVDGAQMRLKPRDALQWHFLMRMVRGAKLESSAIERK
jgi:hypothetical protein